MEEMDHNSVTTREKHFGVATPPYFCFGSSSCFVCVKTLRGGKVKDLVQEERMPELGPSVSGVHQSHLKPLYQITFWRAHNSGTSKTLKAY